jgi:hypothetical protein
MAGRWSSSPWTCRLTAGRRPMPSPRTSGGTPRRNASPRRTTSWGGPGVEHRITSYHLPGQELATLVGLSVWNLRIARGFALEPPPAEHPVQRLRRPLADERVPTSWPRDPVILSTLGGLDWPTMLGRPALPGPPAPCTDDRPTRSGSMRSLVSGHESRRALADPARAQARRLG